MSDNQDKRFLDGMIVKQCESNHPLIWHTGQCCPFCWAMDNLYAVINSDMAGKGAGK